MTDGPYRDQADNPPDPARAYWTPRRRAALAGLLQAGGISLGLGVASAAIVAPGALAATGSDWWLVAYPVELLMAATVWVHFADIW